MPEPPAGRGGPQEIPRPSVWSPGRPAPWSGFAEELLRPGPERVREALPAGRRGRPSPVESEGGMPSAVLIPLYEGPDGLEVVLTRRDWNLRTHRGEVSFPGGRAEPGETHAATARREAFEEVSLDPASVETLGELDHLTTVTRRAYIVPVVALLAGRPELHPNDGEVDAVLHVPLAELLLPEVFREERWGDEVNGRPVYFFELVGDTVWGATAAMLRQLLCRLAGADPGGDEENDPARGAPPGFRLTPEQERNVV
ncbi:MAG: NUDIX hydrolase [Microthrixaceae bacterium]